ncbi:MAG TPA: DUF2442 domain-containing protein [bacterium]|nr:DUF2442 domain-containing protein [bacterium]
MHFDIKKAVYLGGYKIKLFFRDKKIGIVDFENYPPRKGVFEKFKEIEFFKQFYIDPDFNVLAWPGGIDIAPETIYEIATNTKQSS